MKIIASIKNIISPLIAPQVPQNISARFRHLDEHGMGQIETSLRTHYFIDQDAWYSDSNYLASKEGQEDLQDHLDGRLNNFRSTVIPWLNSVKPLANARILEIGCGTGVSTVALAEQGATVTAVDIIEESLKVAQERCKLYDLKVKFFCANATELHTLLAGQQFDFIIFFACLEHLTNSERIIAMKTTWEMLSPGSLWCVIETPNRLWYFDHHTSQLPFYSWLPDDIAFLYSKSSPRKPFCNLYRDINEHSMIDFLRRGRGVSFHEFELTMKSIEELNVVSSFAGFVRGRNLLTKFLWWLKDKSSFEAALVKVGPRIHKGFYQQSLDLILKKD